MENGVRHTSIFGLGRVKIVWSSVGFDGHILQKSILVNGAVNIGLCFLREVDRLGIATPFKVKDAIVVPSMLVIANQGAMRIRGKSRLSGTTETKEECHISLLSHIGRAVYGEVPCHWQPVVHETEKSFFVFTTVPGTENDCLFFFDVNDDGSIAVQIVLDPVIVHLTAAVDDGKIRFKAFKFLGRFGANEHVGDCGRWEQQMNDKELLAWCFAFRKCFTPKKATHKHTHTVRTKMLLPRHFVHKANLPLRRLVCATEAIKDIGRFSRIEIRDRLVVEFLKDLRRSGLINVIPVNMFRRFGSRIQNNPSIFGRTSRELSRVDGKRVAVLGLGNDTFVVGHFVIKQFLIRQVAVDGARSRDSELVNARFATRVRALQGGTALIGITACRVVLLFGRRGRRGLEFVVLLQKWSGSARKEGLGCVGSRESTEQRQDETDVND